MRRNRPAGITGVGEKSPAAWGSGRPVAGASRLASRSPSVCITGRQSSERADRAQGSTRAVADVVTAPGPLAGPYSSTRRTPGDLIACGGQEITDDSGFPRTLTRTNADRWRDSVAGAQPSGPTRDV